jgi:hypothetical protein
MEGRRREGLLLLAGQRDPNSPLSLIDTYRIRTIMHIRSAPVHTVYHDRDEWRDIDTGQLHNRGDQPADMRADGTRYWYKEGKRHRDGDQPAVVRPDGYRCWCKNGLKHRDGDQPAVVRPDRYRCWYKNGLKHRDGDEPAVIFADGSRCWYKNDLKHRDGDQPAVVMADKQVWQTLIVEMQNDNFVWLFQRNLCIKKKCRRRSFHSAIFLAFSLSLPPAVCARGVQMGGKKGVKY